MGLKFVVPNSWALSFRDCSALYKYPQSCNPSHAPDTTHKGVSENSVPLNPMVNDRYPY